MTEVIVKKHRGQSAEHMAKIRAMRKLKTQDKNLQTVQDINYEVSKTMPGPGNGSRDSATSNGSNSYADSLPIEQPKQPTVVKLPALPRKYLSVQRLGGLYTLATLTLQDGKIIAETLSEPDIKPIVLEAFKIAAAKEFFVEHSVQTGLPVA